MQDFILTLIFTVLFVGLISIIGLIADHMPDNKAHKHIKKYYNR